MSEPRKPNRYRKPISRLWWLQSRSHLIFAAREFSCIFVAGFVVYILMLVHAVHAGEDRYKNFVTGSGAGWVVAVKGIAVLFLLIHTVTWFNQTPQAFVLRLGGQRVARSWVVTSIYLLWFLLSGSSTLMILG